MRPPPGAQNRKDQGVGSLVLSEPLARRLSCAEDGWIMRKNRLKVTNGRRRSFKVILAQVVKHMGLLYLLTKATVGTAALLISVMLIAMGRHDLAVHLSVFIT